MVNKQGRETAVVCWLGSIGKDRGPREWLLRFCGGFCGRVRKCDSLHFTTATAWMMNHFWGRESVETVADVGCLLRPLSSVWHSGIQGRGGTRETGMEDRNSVENKVENQSRMSHNEVESAEVAGRSIDCSFRYC